MLVRYKYYIYIFQTNVIIIIIAIYMYTYRYRYVNMLMSIVSTPGQCRTKPSYMSCVFLQLRPCFLSASTTPCKLLRSYYLSQPHPWFFTHNFTPQAFREEPFHRNGHQKRNISSAKCVVAPTYNFRQLTKAITISHHSPSNDPYFGLTAKAYISSIL